MITTYLVTGIVLSSIFRGLFTFGFLMRFGQMLLERHKNESNVNARKFVWKPLAWLWALGMFISAVVDIAVNITLMTILFWEMPSAFNETFSYRIGRYIHNKAYDGDWRQQMAKPICRVLAFLEGQDHCAYIYGAIPCPYPDLKVLF